MLTQYWLVDREKPDIKTISRAADIIKRGGLVAFPTETVYGLGANGLSSHAVKAIYDAKGRPSDNPLILHIADFSEVDKLVRSIPDTARILMEKYWPGPLTIVLHRTPAVPDIVSGGLDTVAIRMPVSKIAAELIRLSGVPIAAPSANTSGRPSPTNAHDVLSDLNGKVDAVIDGGSCDIGVESTVIDCTLAVPTILRPGGITFEMLKETLGEVAIDPALSGAATLKPRAPGMKYRHYAPKASVIVIEADDKQAENILQRETIKALEQGKRVGLLLSDGAAKLFVDNFKKSSNSIIVHTYGDKKEPWQLAAMFYTLLRRFDNDGVDIIYAEGVSDVGIGRAVMNRMRKSSGFNILRS